MLLLAACTVGAFAPAFAGDSAASPAVPQRARIGLVLSGGGARGAAHLGVLKVLRELRVPIDVIAGTSAGAIVGAAYASGMPIEEIESVMRGLSTASLVRERDRADLPEQVKEDDQLNFIGPEIGIGPAGVSLPKGVLSGVSVERVLRRLTDRQRDEDFDRLPIPFRAVATDLVSSEMIVIGHGSLARAARASMAVPAAIDPVEIDGRLLVDGGLVRNLPVDVARSLGADVVIAVNIGTPLLRREQIVSVLSVSDQMIRIMTEANVRQSLAELGQRDVLVTPALAEVSSGDFGRLERAEQAGELAARLVALSLARYSVDERQYAAFEAARTRGSYGQVKALAAVRIDGVDPGTADAIRSRLRAAVGEPPDAAVVEADVRRVYGLGDFEHVGYELSDGAGGDVLTLHVRPKSWGPNFVRFGLGLASDFQGNAFFSLYARHHRSFPEWNGASWHSLLRIGHVDQIRTEWRQPLERTRRLFAAIGAELERRPFELFDDDRRIARYRRQRAVVRTDLGVELGPAELRAGIVSGRVRLLDDTGQIPAALLLPGGAGVGGFSAGLRYDSLDDARFPQRGFAADLKAFASRGPLGATDAYTRVDLALAGAASRGAHSVLATLDAEYGYGDRPLPVYELASLGGFRRLAGYQTDQLLGRNLLFGRLAYRYRLSTPGLLDGTYVGMSVERAHFDELLLGAPPGTMLAGGSVYLAFDSPLGPVYLAYGVARGGRSAAYLYVGQP